jgi:exodeoxyribonuclease-3
MFTKMIKAGWVDTFREKYPDEKKYSWWSMRTGARAKNFGWRIDYFIISDESKDAVLDSRIETKQIGSDHCPVEIDLDLEKLI